jgi:hypothetical protein
MFLKSMEAAKPCLHCSNPTFNVRFRTPIFILGVGVICYSKGAWRHRARPPIGTLDPHANAGRNVCRSGYGVHACTDVVSMHVQMYTGRLTGG